MAFPQGTNKVSTVLYDESGNPVGIILDGAIYRLQTESKLVAGSAEVGKVAQGTKAIDSAAWPFKLTNSAGDKVVTLVDDTTTPANKRAMVEVDFKPGATLSVTTAPSNSKPGFSFGDVTTAVIALAAVRRTTYNEPTAGAQRSISSSNANDTAAGTGARTVRITYYTLTAGVVAGPFTEDKTLSGTTPVNTTATDICFIENIEVLTVGSTGSNVGILTLFNSTAGGGGTLGTIAATNNQTFWNHHYVATGKTCHVSALWAGHTGTTVGSGATLYIRTKTIGVTNAVERQVTDSFRLYGQSSSIQRNYGSPIEVAGPARLLMYVTPETATSVNYRGSFDFYDD